MAMKRHQTFVIVAEDQWRGDGRAGLCGIAFALDAVFHRFALGTISTYTVDRVKPFETVLLVVNQEVYNQRAAMLREAESASRGALRVRVLPKRDGGRVRRGGGVDGGGGNAGDNKLPQLLGASFQIRIPYLVDKDKCILAAEVNNSNDSAVAVATAPSSGCVQLEEATEELRFALLLNLSRQFHYATPVHVDLSVIIDVWHFFNFQRQRNDAFTGAAFVTLLSKMNAWAAADNLFMSREFRSAQECGAVLSHTLRTLATDAVAELGVAHATDERMLAMMRVPEWLAATVAVVSIGLALWR